MRPLKILLAVGLLYGVCVGVRAADEDAKLAAQKKAAEANWSTVTKAAPVKSETEHLLIYASAGLEKKLRDIGILLEKHYISAEKALQIKPREELWPGKLTVYLFTEREEFIAFIRRIEKRRLEADDLGSHDVDTDVPHAVAGPPRGKQDPVVEMQAANQVAAALLGRKAGVKVVIPEWLIAGFARATYYRVSPRDRAVTSDRQRAAQLAVIVKRNARDVWGGALDNEEAPVLAGSLVDYLAYGPGAGKFNAFIAGFKPGENMGKRNTDQALEAAGLNAENLDKMWREWVRNPR